MATKKPAKTPAKKTAKKPAAKKPVKKAAVKKKVAPKKAAAPKAPKPIGRVTHYFDHLKVAVISLEKGKSLKVGDSIRIEGGEVDFVQPIQSLQVDHEDVASVKAGDDFGTKVKKLVREGYRVHKA
jgi:translation elongation factor EF-1alpha